jgi:type I restriction enzyme S subunit
LNDITYIPEELNDQMRGSIVQSDDVLLNITGASIGRSCVVP